MRISTCSKSQAKNYWPDKLDIENLERTPQIFNMTVSYPSPSEPEVLSPAALSRLSELEARHEVEALQLARLEGLATLMDARFKLPILPLPIGLDTIIGLIPGIGDTISLGVAGVIVAGARKLDIPTRHLTLMGGNIAIDWAIGLVPVIGDLFDIGWQGNVRNVKIARAHLEERWARECELAARDV